MVSNRGRVVKALDLKSNGVSPRRFESCRLRSFFLSLEVICQSSVYNKHINLRLKTVIFC